MKKFFVVVILALVCFEANAQKWSIRTIDSDEFNYTSSFEVYSYFNNDSSADLYLLQISSADDGVLSIMSNYEFFSVPSKSKFGLITNVTDVKIGFYKNDECLQVIEERFDCTGKSLINSNKELIKLIIEQFNMRNSIRFKTLFENEPRYFDVIINSYKD